MKKPVEPDDFEGACRRILSLVKDRDYTEGRLKDKLLKAGYSEETASASVLWAREHKYVDDAIYCRLFIEQQSGRRSRFRMKADLLGRGVPSDLVEDALSSIPDEGGELQAALRKLRSRHFDPGETDPAYIRKTAAFLFRQGFSSDVIREAMSLDTDSLLN